MLWRKAIIYWRSFLVICAIAYVSLLREPNVTLPPIVGIDKYIHGVMYWFLTWVLLWDSIGMEWYRGGNGKGKYHSYKGWLVVIILPMAYGGFIEILQDKFFYPRTGDWRDWLADCAGVLLGEVLWIIGKKWYERRMA